MSHRPPAPLLARLLTTLAVAVLLLASGAPALAQDAPAGGSPVASPAAGGGAGPQVGDAVLLFNVNGRELAQVAVTQIVDPFTEVDAPAETGFHFVMLELVVQNTSDAPYTFDQYQVTVVDGQGTTAQPTFVSRPFEAAEAQPDFNAGEIAPGQSASGVLFYQVADGQSVAFVAQSDSFQRFVVLLDQRPSIPALGQPVTTYDTTGAESAVVTVDAVESDLEMAEPGFALRRGETVLALTVTVENAGSAALTNPASALRVVDEFGSALFPSYGFREEAAIAARPDFPTEDIAPGATASGAVFFAFPIDAVLTYVVYSPDFAKLAVVAQPGPGSAVSGDALTPVAVPTTAPTEATATEEAFPTEVVTDCSVDPLAEGCTPVEEETPVLPTGDCGDLQPWVDATGENFAGAEEIDPFGGDELDAAELRDGADALRDIADAQEDIDTPEIAQETQASLLVFIRAYADGLDRAADELDAGTPSADVLNLLFSDTTFTDAVVAVEDAQAALELACPDVDFTALE